MREYIAIDFETANEKRDSACALGIAVVHGGRVVERRSWLIRPPEMRFSPFNIAVHGIRPAQVIGAPRFVDLWPEVQDYLTSGPVIAHNAGFDISVLAGTLSAYRIPAPEFDYACTVNIARNVWPQLPSFGLKVVAAHLGIDFVHHDAAEDAVAAAGIAISACRQTGAASLKDLIKTLNLKPRRFDSTRR